MIDFDEGAGFLSLLAKTNHINSKLEDILDIISTWGGFP